MRPRRDHRDEDRLFEGGASGDPLAALFAAVRRAYSQAPGEDVRARHLALIAATEPVAAGPRVGVRRTRRVARAGVFAAGLALVGGSAMAGTGTLPDPAQDLVSDVARQVGIDIPRGRALGHEKRAARSGDDEGAGQRSSDRGGPSAENKAAADAFTTAKKEWTACVAAAESARAETDETGPIDHEEACGPKPTPSRPEKTEKPGKPERTANPAAARTPNPNAGQGGPPDGVDPGAGAGNKPAGAGPAAGSSSGDAPAAGRGNAPTP